MSKRLAYIASRVARKRSRGVAPDQWPTVERVTGEDDLWPDIPEDQRIAKVETLPNGTVMTTYMDTLDDFEVVPEPAAKLPPPAERSPAPPEAPPRAEGGSPWAFRGTDLD
jgi:hypothetical protein